MALHIDIRDYPTDVLIPYPAAQMTAAALALAGAQNDIGFWNNERGRMAENLIHTELSVNPRFSYRMGDMDITCDVDTYGFSQSYHGITAVNKSNRFLLEFTAGSDTSE